MQVAAQAAENKEDSPTSATLGDVLGYGRVPAIAEADWVGLVRSVAGGDELALHALYERANRVVFTLAMRLTGSRETAEELTVDVFHDVWRRAVAYDPANGTVLGWIMNQARSRTIDRLRFESRKKRVSPADEPATAADEPLLTEEMLDFKERSLALRMALAELTPAEREAIEAAFFSELTHAEVAAKLEQPLGTVKTRIRSGLHKLREALGAPREES